ncbi:MAG: hypothetical protein KIS76_04310 [Pyrinomonadaceae bacterium]|nr:hypothetical protein [Pyrinomonadaceae bacterium]
MSETGHAINVESLKTARDFAVSWKAKYQPSNPIIAVQSMNDAIAAAEPALDNVIAAKTPYRNATAAAQDAFDPLNQLTS